MKKNLGIIALIVAIAAVFSFAFDFTDANAQQSKVTVSDVAGKKGRTSPTPVPTRTAYWTGNGATYDGESFEFTSSRCEESEGRPYIYWVLTAGGRDSSDNAQISINGSNLVSMSRVSKGSFKYTQTFESGFVAPTNVSATYTNAKSANLVISHGCTGGEVPVVPSFKFSLGEGVDGSTPFSYLAYPCPDPIAGTPGVLSDFTAAFTDTCPTDLVNLIIPADGIEVTGPCSESVDESENDIYVCAIIERDTVITINSTGGGGNPDDFIIKVSSDVVPFKFTLPLRGTPVNPNDEFGDRLNDVDVTINWGTGAPAECPTSATASGNVTCRYTTAGTYTITVGKGSKATGPWLYGFGSFDYLWPDYEYDPVFVEIRSASITEVVSFGNLGITSFLNGFTNMKTNPQMPATLPATVRSMRSMFEEASNFNQDLSSWNTESVTNMEQMFAYARAFNNGCADGVTTCPLAWNTSSVTNMRAMFIFNDIFNQNIGTWNTSSVTDMGQVFNNAPKFNQNIGSWVTGGVTNMSNMFNGASAFNQNISGWNTGNVTNMDQMFLEARAFNQPIGVWNTGKVVVMRNMFYRANAFNQPIGTWDVSSVRYLLGDEFGGGFGFQGMFYENTGFNQDLSAWCVSPLYTGPASTFNTRANSTWVNNASFQPQWGSPPASCIE
jgi:surface protein